MSPPQDKTWTPKMTTCGNFVAQKFSACWWDWNGIEKCRSTAVCNDLACVVWANHNWFGLYLLHLALVLSALAISKKGAKCLLGERRAFSSCTGGKCESVSITALYSHLCYEHSSSLTTKRHLYFFPLENHTLTTVVLTNRWEGISSGENLFPGLCFKLVNSESHGKPNKIQN